MDDTHVDVLRILKEEAERARKLAAGEAVEKRHSDPGDPPKPDPPKRRSDPGARPTFKNRPHASVEGIAWEALEQGLNLQVHKDESTKEASFSWSDASALRRGMTVLAVMFGGIFLLMFLSGHWYFGQIESALVFTRVNQALDEYKFHEDVQALAQTISLAHFTDLAFRLHSDVSLFLDAHDEAQEGLVKSLQEHSHQHWRNINHQFANSSNDTAEVRKLLQDSQSHLRHDINDVMQSFATSVSHLGSHVDELGDLIENADASLLHMVMASLIRQTVRRAEGVPTRERMLTTNLRPQLRTFFENYQTFVRKYSPMTTPPLDNDLIRGLHDVWTCAYKGTQTPAANATLCEVQLQKLVPKQEAATLPAHEAYTEVLAQHGHDYEQSRAIADYVRSVFYIEHMRRLSRSTLTHLERHSKYQYRCTTCASEVDVLVAVLTLVESGAVHPRWLSDPHVVSDGVVLSSPVPEGQDMLEYMLKKGKLLSGLGGASAGFSKAAMNSDMYNGKNR